MVPTSFYNGPCTRSLYGPCHRDRCLENSVFGGNTDYAHHCTVVCVIVFLPNSASGIMHSVCFFQDSGATSWAGSHAIAKIHRGRWPGQTAQSWFSIPGHALSWGLATTDRIIVAPWLRILYALSVLCRQWLQRTPLCWKCFGLGVVLALRQLGLKPKLGLCVLLMRLDMKHVAGKPYALTPENPSLASPEQLGGLPA